MSLDVYLKHCGRSETTVYSANITHNLNEMAKAAGIYDALWYPERIQATKAKDLIKLLHSGLKWLKANEQEARKHDSPNGWGLYEHFVPFVEKYLAACVDNPNATVSVWR